MFAPCDRPSRARCSEPAIEGSRAFSVNRRFRNTGFSRGACLVRVGDGARRLSYSSDQAGIAQKSRAPCATLPAKNHRGKEPDGRRISPDDEKERAAKVSTMRASDIYSHGIHGQDGKIRASGSLNTEAASVNCTRCFPEFDLAFHSTRRREANYKILEMGNGQGETDLSHNKMEFINRQAYGFRNFQNYILRIKVLCS